MKKSQLLKEGFIKGLRKALRVIQRQLNESWRDSIIDEIAQWFSSLRENKGTLQIEGIFSSGSGRGRGRFEEVVKGLNYDKDSDVLVITLQDGEKIRVVEFTFAWEEARLFYGKTEGLHMQMEKGFINQREVSFDYLAIVPKK